MACSEAYASSDAICECSGAGDVQQSYSAGAVSMGPTSKLGAFIVAAAVAMHR
jgi:hypothetical protein